MKTILDPLVKNRLAERIVLLDSSAQARWGKMNVHQAICHLHDQLKDLQGLRPVRYEGNPFFRHVLRPIISVLPSWPKAKFPTASQYDQMKDGTKPVDFVQDKQALLKAFTDLDLHNSKKELPPHPAFGRLSNSQYARIVYQHFDHHLKQFGA